MEKEREMSLVLIVFALLCGRDDQESVPVMSHNVLAAYDVSADIIYGIRYTVYGYVTYRGG
jgi:hypothetical protein